MTTLLNRYLAYQRDIGVDEVILTEPWVEPKSKSDFKSGESLRGNSQVPVSQHASLVPTELDSLNAQEAIRKISARLMGTQVEAVNSRADLASTSPETSRLIKEKEVKPLPVLEFADMTDWQAAFLEAAPGLHPMGAGRKTPAWILSKGVASPLFAVISLQPSADADATSGPFAGEEGVLLEKMLRAIKMDPNEMVYASLMKARHLGRGWARKDMVKLLPWLAAELRILRPQMILAMGEDVAQILARVGQGYEMLRQKSWEFGGFEMAMTLDPARLLAQEELKKDAWRDLQWLMQRLKEKEATL